jgi:hypothetical protein
MDPLRIRLRDAMVQFLLTKGFSNEIYSLGHVEFSSTNSLYEYFLIDTQMNPCATTSRIVQATLAIQLFVQRVQLNLETRVSLSHSEAEKWLWYKHYRVWEACRRIFLYPENWLEPEWRLNKTEIFATLENYLRQNDVTSEVAEKAFYNYFEELENIGKIEIASIYREDINKEGADQEFITHFVGRTRSHPHTFYYRKFDNISWTPWEKIDTDIESENVTLVVWEGMVYLFWPLITTEKAKPATIQDLHGLPKPFPNYKEFEDSWENFQSTYYNFLREEEYNAALKIKVSYTCKVNEKWQSKKVGKEGLLINHLLLIFNWDSTYNSYKTYNKCQADKVSIFPISDQDSQDNLNLALVFGDIASDDSLVLQFTFDKQKRFSFYPDNLPYYGFPWDSNNHLKDYQIESPGYVDSQSIVNNLGTDVLVYNEIEDYPQIPLFREPRYSNRISYGNTLYYRKEFNLFDPTNKLLMPFIYDEPLNIWYGIPVLEEKCKMSYSAGLFKQVIAEGFNSLNPLGINDDFKDLGDSQSFYSLENSNKIVLPNEITYPFVKIPKTYGTEGELPTTLIYLLYPFDHPFIADIRAKLTQSGISGLFNPDPLNVNDPLFRQRLITPLDQLLENLSATSFIQIPKGSIEIDFTYRYPFAKYNWELFFHVPMMIAGKLSANKQYEDAQKWYHFVFDPTFGGLSEDTPQQRAWKFGPFATVPGISDIRDLMHQIVNYNSQVIAWQNDPDNPFLIADIRLFAYMRNVVMKYLDNLVAWGDDLFEQDTMESLNEATQLYILAYEILGPRMIPVETTFPEPESYNYLLSNGLLDDFSNQLQVIETYNNITNMPEQGNSSISEDSFLEDLKNYVASNNSSLSSKNIATVISSLYFGIPYNDKLLGYWDLVEDRLYKLRNSLNIKGIKRELPLFAPPIDPALLVQAGALGLDLSQVLNNQAMPLSGYRFKVIIQKAKELAGEVIALGSSLLSALEKKDSEALSILKAGQEKALLNLVSYIKQQAITESQHSVESLEESLSNAQNRVEYYKGRSYLNDKEKEYLSKMTSAHQYQTKSQELILLKSILGLIPQFHVSLPPASEFGGVQLSIPAEVNSQIAGIKSNIAQYESSVASIYAGYDRRMDDWQFQRAQAEGESQSLAKQIAAANIRLAISQKELENHEKQIEQSEETFEFLKSKFTNEDMYGWMVSEISNVYFQSYKLAVQYARQAEKAYQFEMATGPIDNFISYGYWDSLRQGLMSGEKLRMDLNLLEKAYFDANTRENEMTRHVSLALLNPMALNDLKISGKCNFAIPEMLYDMDFPGQYMRRIKSVALTIPAVVGPFTNISCQLSLTKSCYRQDPKCNGTDYEMEADDSRFVFDPIGIQSISTSNGQNDRGMFEFNFNDERYLPFEGAGAISNWQLELPDEFRQFDYQTIADIILHISYSSRDAGGLLKEGCLRNIKEIITPTGVNEPEKFWMAMDWKAQFPDELYKLKTTPTAITTLKLRKDQFPAFITNYLAANTSTKKLYITGLTFYTKGINPSPYHISFGTVNSNSGSQTVVRPEYLGVYSSLSPAGFGNGIELGEEKQLSINTSGTPTIDNIWMMVQYRIGS